MRQIVFCFLVLIPVLSFSQISITADDMPDGGIFPIQSGDQFLVIDASYDAYTQEQLLMTGEDVSWNFIKLGLNAIDTLNYTTPEGANFTYLVDFSIPFEVVSIFPYEVEQNPHYSNLAINKEPQDFMAVLSGGAGILAAFLGGVDLTIDETTELYYNDNGNFILGADPSKDVFTQVGMGVIISTSGIPIGLPVPFDPVDTIFTFPLTYGTEPIFSYTSYRIEFDSSTSIVESYDRTTIVDGYGTLTTAFGTYDVIRVKSTKDIIDTFNLYISGAPGFLGGPEQSIRIPRTETEYMWLAKDGGVPILQINTSDGLFGEQIDKVYFKYDQTTAIKSNENTAVRMYPNPTNGSLNISGMKELSFIRVYNLSGELVLSEDALSNGTQRFSIDLNPGVYLIEAGNNEYIERERIIVR